MLVSQPSSAHASRFLWTCGRRSCIPFLRNPPCPLSCCRQADKLVCQQANRPGGPANLIFQDRLGGLSHLMDPYHDVAVSDVCEGNNHVRRLSLSLSPVSSSRTPCSAKSALSLLRGKLQSFVAALASRRVDQQRQIDRPYHAALDRRGRATSC